MSRGGKCWGMSVDRDQCPDTVPEGDQRNLVTLHTSPHRVGVKCPDDETNEQRILRATAITLSDHRAVYDAKCGLRKGDGGLIKFGHLRTGEGVGIGDFFADVLYGRPLWT